MSVRRLNFSGQPFNRSQLALHWFSVRPLATATAPEFQTHSVKDHLQWRGLWPESATFLLAWRVPQKHFRIHSRSSWGGVYIHVSDEQFPRGVQPSIQKMKWEKKKQCHHQTLAADLDAESAYILHTCKICHAWCCPLSTPLAHIRSYHPSVLNP